MESLYNGSIASEGVLDTFTAYTAQEVISLLLRVYQDNGTLISIRTTED